MFQNHCFREGQILHIRTILPQKLQIKNFPSCGHFGGKGVGDRQNVKLPRHPPPCLEPHLLYMLFCFYSKSLWIPKIRVTPLNTFKVVASSIFQSKSTRFITGAIRNNYVLVGVWINFYTLMFSLISIGEFQLLAFIIFPVILRMKIKIIRTFKTVS